MSERDYRLFLNDIKECADNVLNYTRGKCFDDFMHDRMLRDAVIRNLEIMGEAVKNLPDEVRERHLEIEWREIARFRDVVAHRYFATDYEIIWDIVQKDIPDLVPKIEEVIEKESKARL